MSLLGLPNELLQLIATFLDDECDVAALVAVNQRLYRLLLLYLYTLNRDSNGSETAETWAVSKDRLDVLRRIYNLGVESNSKQSIFDAAEAGSLAVFKFLLERYPRHDKPEFDELLHPATCSNNCELIAYLLEGGADPNCTNEVGETPIFHVASGLDPSVGALLLQHGADVNMTKSDGWTPLGWSSGQLGEKMMRFLIENGADIDALGVQGRRTVLQNMARRGDVKKVSFLLRRGANRLIRSSDGNTALDYAVSLNHPAVAEKLLEHDCWDKVDVRRPPLGRTPLHSAVAKRNPTMVTVILESARPWVDQQDLWGRTAAFYAAKFGTIQILNQLMAYGADLSIADRYGATPLMVAVRNQQANIIEHLLQTKGDCLGEKDVLGRTIFWWAKATGDSQLLDILTSHASEVGFEIDPSDLEADKSVIKYNRNNCWCDICTRALGGIRNGHRCLDCGDGWFLICNDCFADERLSCSPEHGRERWIPYRECSCPVYSER